MKYISNVTRLAALLVVGNQCALNGAKAVLIRVRVLVARLV